MGALAAGVDAARGEIVLLLDDDVLPRGPLASGHRAHHVVGQGLVVVGAMPVDADTDAAMTATSRIYAQAYLGHCGELVRGDVGVLETLWFGNVSLARDDCRTVGLCNEAFRATYHLDREFGYRLADAGLVGVFDPRLRAVHRHSRSIDSFLRAAVARGAALVELHRLHGARLGPFRIEDLWVRPSAIGTAVLRWSASSGRRRTTLVRTAIGVAALARRLHLRRVEVDVTKLAQHIMEIHGALDARGG